MLIPFEKLVRDYGIQPRGILHLGAHLAEEAEDYHRFGVDNVLWVEAIPDLIESIRQKVEPWGHMVCQGVVSAESDREVEFKITNNGQSSSYLDLGTHAQLYPEIQVVRTLTMKTTTVQNIYRDEGLAADEFDFVNLDLQGSELDALQGMGPLLDNFNTVYTEVNKEAIYKGCALLPEMDRFLRERGFSRRALSLTRRHWGDALYTRGKVSWWSRLFGGH